MADGKTELKIIARIRDFATKRFRAMGTAAKVFGRVGAKAVRGVGKAALFAMRSLTSLRGLLIGAGGLFLGGSIARSTHEIALQTNEFGKWATKLRIGVKELSELAFAAEQNGVNFDALTDGLKNMLEKVDDAARGTGTYVEHMESIGVSALDARGNLRSLTDLLPEFAAGVQRLAQTDPERLTLFSADFFGDQAQFLQILLEKGPEAIRVYSKVANEVGAIVTPEQAKRAKEWVQNWRGLQSIIAGVRRDVVSEVLPTKLLNALANFIAENRDQVVQTIAAGLRTAGRLALQLLETLLNLLEALQSFSLSNIPLIGGPLEDLRQAVFGGLTESGQAARKEIKQVAADVLIMQRAIHGAANPDQLKLYQDHLEDLKRKGRELNEVFVEHGGAGGEFQKQLDRLLVLDGASRAASIDFDQLAERFANKIFNPAQTEEFIASLQRAATQQPRNRTIVEADRELDYMRDFFGFFNDGIDQGITRWTEFGRAGLNAGRDLVDSIGGSLSNALAAGITRIRSWKDAWKEAGNAILQTLAQIVSQLAVMGLFRGIGSLFGLPGLGAIFAAKGAFFPGGLRRLAMGGVTNGPEIAVIGDNPGGREFVMPAARGPDGKLGVRAHGGGGGRPVVVENEFKIYALDGADVQTVLAKNMKQVGQVIASAIEGNSGGIKVAIREAR